MIKFFHILTSSVSKSSYKWICRLISDYKEFIWRVHVFSDGRGCKMRIDLDHLKWGYDQDMEISNVSANSNGVFKKFRRYNFNLSFLAIIIK